MVKYIEKMTSILNPDFFSQTPKCNSNVLFKLEFFSMTTSIVMLGDQI